MGIWRPVFHTSFCNILRDTDFDGDTGTLLL
jgi:hypothetical protein